MEDSYQSSNGGMVADSGIQVVRHTSYQPCSKLSLTWFDLRVFYVRISNYLVDNLTPEFLTLNHIPLSPDTLLEVNGARCSANSEGISSLLRRDRVDKKSEEVTFVSTDSIRLTGSVKFEVFDKEDLVLHGVLEVSNTNGNSNGFTGDSKANRKWCMNCEPMMTAACGFLKGKQIVECESMSPSIEVYVAGSFSGKPIILTKTMQLGLRKKQSRKGMLDSIPEYETTESPKSLSSGLDLQVAEYRKYKTENEEDYNNSLYWRRTEYIDGEDGELNWFNAGVRVGVGIGLGVCLGVGIGVGLLVRTYQSTTRNFTRRFT